MYAYGEILINLEDIKDQNPRQTEEPDIATAPGGIEAPSIPVYAYGRFAMNLEDPTDQTPRQIEEP